MSSKVCKLI
jgi:hypothetical protein